MWYRLSKDEKEKHIHVMKIYLLSPFLFGQVVNQEDKVMYQPVKEQCSGKGTVPLKDKRTIKRVSN